MHPLILSALLAGAAAAMPASSLVLIDGQSVSGQPAHLQPSARPLADLVWSNGDLHTFPQRNILEIRLPAKPIAQADGPVAVLTLNNGDCLRGQLAGVDETTITLKTHFADELKFRREMVKSLRITRPPHVMVAAAGADWAVSPPDGWTSHGNSLVASSEGLATLRLPFPEQFRISFTLEWKEHPDCEILFLADASNHTGYVLSIGEDAIYLGKRLPTKDGDYEEQAFEDAEFTLNRSDERGKIHFEIVCDSRTGTVGVAVDGRLVMHVIDPSPPPRDNAVQLAIATQAVPMRFSAFTMTAWNGDLASSSADPIDPEAPRPNELFLRNGDIVTTTAIHVHAGQADAQSIHGPIKIPIERLRSIGMPSPTGNPPTPKRLLGDVRAWLADGSRLTFRLDAIDQDKITGFSQQFGTAQFNLDAFQRLELNLDLPNLDPLRSKSPW